MIHQQNSLAFGFELASVRPPITKRTLRIVRAPRLWLGSLASVSLLRLVTELPAVVRTAIDLWSVPGWVPAAVSVLAGGFEVVETPVTLGLLAATLYVLVPRLYPEETTLPAEDPAFKLIVVGLALATATLLSQTTTETLVWGIAGGAVMILVASGAFLTCLSVRHDWELLDPSVPPVEPLAFFSTRSLEDVRTEITADLARSGVAGVAGAVIWLVALGLVVSMPATVAGGLVRVLANAFPLPELLVIGWTGVGVVERVRWLPSPPPVGEIDPESRLFPLAATVTHGPTGAYLSLFTAVGLISASLYVLIGVRLATWVPSVESVVAAPIIAFGLVGRWLVPVVVGAYSLWYWLRQFERIGVFLTASSDGSTAPLTPARPPGFTLPPAVAVVTMGLVADMAGPTIVGLVTVVSVVGLAGLAVWTRDQSTPVGRERVAVTVGLAVQYLGVTTLAERPWRAVTTKTPTAEAVPYGPFAAVGLLIVVATIPELYRVTIDSPGRYRGGLYCLLGLVVWVVGGPATDVYAVTFQLVAAALVGGGLAVWLTAHYES